MLIGIDCEWRPQFLTKERTVDTEYVLSGKDSNNQIDEDQSGLSIYQLAVGDIVYVIDVQVLGQAASAPLSYIWRPTSRLLLIGFCVSSDIQRIKSSFPELRVLFARTNETTHDVAPLLLELKELALFRHVPAKNWGLSRLYRACLGGQVDKEQQCSDWGSRPLSSDQLEYAAKDAYVVQRLTLHLLADVKFTCVGAEKDSVSNRIMNYMKCFDASSSLYSQSWMASISQPLGKQHVKDALEALGIPARFERCDDSSEGLLVKSIALVIRKENVSNAPRRLSYAVAVLSLQRSIDMQSLASLLRVDPEDVFLADQEVRSDPPAVKCASTNRMLCLDADASASIRLLARLPGSYWFARAEGNACDP
ncbi:unnamed protein product [Phytophthora lilii]|uniref:Unnamed protein product n=1 Tax=Phytophthora lilii TaxID=2077276 RepID=A0A9W6TGW0_9STRA|nr:unnamed protein product [Phytophthora lilii]